MADSTIQPHTNHTEEHTQSVPNEPKPENTQPQATTKATSTSPTPSTIIWTPRFIITFASTLASGLSIESLLTQGWQNHFYAAAWVLLAHLALIFGYLIAVIRATRSRWIRIGSIFGCTWAIFTSVNQVLTFYKLDPTSPIPAYLNVTICSALLGCYICLSIEHTALETWDSWFFRLALAIGASVVVIVYLLTPVEDRSLSGLESDIAALGLVLSILVWWLRRSCWKAQPGPTFLFGLTPTILLLLAIPSLGTGSTNLFLSQVALLSFLLGTIRILQGERCSS